MITTIFDQKRRKSPKRSVKNEYQNVPLSIQTTPSVETLAEDTSNLDEFTDIDEIKPITPEHRNYNDKNIQNITRIFTNNQNKNTIPSNYLKNLLNYFENTITSSEQINQLFREIVIRLKKTQENIIKEIGDDIITIHAKLNQSHQTAKEILIELNNISFELGFIQKIINGGDDQNFLPLDKNLTEYIYQKNQDMVAKIEEFADFAVQSSITELGNCSSLFETYKFTTDMICDSIVDTLNGFWFALGFSCVLLPFNIVFGIKLAKFFRRMEIVDEYVDVIDHQHQRHFNKNFGSSRFGTNTTYGHTTEITTEATSYYSED